MHNEGNPIVRISELDYNLRARAKIANSDLSNQADPNIPIATSVQLGLPCYPGRDSNFSPFTKPCLSYGLESLSQDQQLAFPALLQIPP